MQRFQRFSGLKSNNSNWDDYAYGWNEKGRCFHALKSGRCRGRVNRVAAYCNHQLMAPFTIEGGCSRTVSIQASAFAAEAWIETCLIPVLKTRQWLVIDNATFDKGGRIAALIESSGCHVRYLPPYSPDFNKIGQCWSWIKNRIRHCMDEFDCL